MDHLQQKKGHPATYVLMLAILYQYDAIFISNLFLHNYPALPRPCAQIAMFVSVSVRCLVPLHCAAVDINVAVSGPAATKCTMSVRNNTTNYQT